MGGDFGYGGWWGRSNDVGTLDTASLKIRVKKTAAKQEIIKVEK